MKMMMKKIIELLSTKDKIDGSIDLNIYKADNGNLTLVNSNNRLVEIINEEIRKKIII